MPQHQHYGFLLLWTCAHPAVLAKGGVLWKSLCTSATERACGSSRGLLGGRKERMSGVAVHVLGKLSAEEPLC